MIQYANPHGAVILRLRNKMKQIQIYRRDDQIGILMKFVFQNSLKPGRNGNFLQRQGNQRIDYFRFTMIKAFIMLSKIKLLSLQWTVGIYRLNRRPGGCNYYISVGNILLIVSRVHSQKLCGKITKPPSGFFHNPMADHPAEGTGYRYNNG